MRYIALTSLLLMISELFAQTDLRPGYIVYNVKDTIYGEVDFRGDQMMASTCTFKRSSSGMMEAFEPEQLHGYGFTGGKYYISKETKEGDYFLEYLVDGIVDIYYRKENQTDHYYISSDSLPVTEIAYAEGTKYDEEKGDQFFRTTRHIGILNYYMQGVPGFSERIKRVTKPDHASLTKLAREYHKRTNTDKIDDLYVKKTPFLRVFPELLYGIANFPAEQTLTRDWNTTAGLIAHIWMPRVNEKLTFRTGYQRVYAQDREDGRLTTYKIPLQIEYTYPKGSFRPRAAIGMSAYPGNLAPAAMFGFSVQCFNSLFANLNYDIDFNSNKNIPLIPRSLLSNTLTVGVYVKY